MGPESSVPSTVVAVDRRSLGASGGDLNDRQHESRYSNTSCASCIYFAAFFTTEDQTNNAKEDQTNPVAGLFLDAEADAAAAAAATAAGVVALYALV